MISGLNVGAPSVFGSGNAIWMMRRDKMTYGLHEWFWLWIGDLYTDLLLFYVCRCIELRWFLVGTQGFVVLWVMERLFVC